MLLEELDLSPLQSCSRLRNLDLTGNPFSHLDVTPLASVKSLSLVKMDTDFSVYAAPHVKGHIASRGLRAFEDEIRYD